MTNILYAICITKTINAIFTEKRINERRFNKILDFFESLNAKNVQIKVTKEIVKGFSTFISEFNNKPLYLKVLKSFDFYFIDAKGKHHH